MYFNLKPALRVGTIVFSGTWTALALKVWSQVLFG